MHATADQMIEGLQSIWKAIRTSKDLAVFAVVLEDSAALVEVTTLNVRNRTLRDRCGAWYDDFSRCTARM